MNPLADNYNPNASIPDTCTFSPSSLKAAISENYPRNLDHGVKVKEFFDDEYGTTIDSEIYTAEVSDLLVYMEAAGIPIFTRSYTGANYTYPLADQHYPDVLCVMALGSNTHEEINFPMSALICTGARQTGTGDNNDTAYGTSLDFWDFEDDGDLADESSFSTPTIAAKLLKIMEGRNCGNWEARYCARITALRTEARRPPNTLWTNEDGFGRIDVTAAIAYNGSIPADPFLNAGNKYLPFVP